MGAYSCDDAIEALADQKANHELRERHFSVVGHYDHIRPYLSFCHFVSNERPEQDA
jgi:hypothetical protein